MVCVAVGQESCWGRGECRGSGGETAPAFRRCCSGALFRSDGQNNPADGVAGLGLWVGAGQKGSKLTLGEVSLVLLVQGEGPGLPGMVMG